MARGIWQNSLLKIFLTRSCLGSFFRPLLYSKEECIHYSFVLPLTELSSVIVKMRESREKAIAYYWLIEVPRNLFEELFFPDGEDHPHCHLLAYAQGGNAESIAYLTQSYALSYLEHALVRDCAFQEELITTVADLHQIVASLYGIENQVAYYCEIFREKQLDGLIDSNGYDLHYCYAKEILCALTSDLDIDEILQRESAQIHNLAMFGPRKLRNAKITTLRMLDTTKSHLTHQVI